MAFAEPAILPRRVPTVLVKELVTLFALKAP